MEHQTYGKEAANVVLDEAEIGQRSGKSAPQMAVAEDMERRQK